MTGIRVSQKEKGLSRLLYRICGSGSYTVNDSKETASVFANESNLEKKMKTKQLRKTFGVSRAYRKTTGTEKVSWIHHTTFCMVTVT